MNNYSHGMRSARRIGPRESAVLFAEKECELLEALNPTDSVQRMLADRVVLRNWYRLRGERALDGQAAQRIDAIVDGAGERAASAVRRLAPLVDADDEAVHQLRTFPEGVAYLREQYAILQDRLAAGQNLVYTERQRCFRLAAKRPEQVLAGDRVATRLLRAQIGMMLGQEGTLEEVASFLGTDPPDGMPYDEFSIRVKTMADSVETKDASLLRLTSYLSEAVSELTALQSSLEEVAQRTLQNQAEGALVDSTPAGARVLNYILGVDRGCDAALRRLEIRQKPGPRGAGNPKSEIRNPKEARNPNEESSNPPECRPTTERRCRRTLWPRLRPPSRPRCGPRIRHRPS